LTLACADLLESRGSKLTLLKSSFNSKNFIRKLSQSVLNHFGTIHSWNLCHSAKLQTKFTKTSYFGGSRAFKVIHVDISKKLVASFFMISRMSVLICNHFYARATNKCKITFFSGVCPSFHPSFEENFTQQHKIFSRNTRDSRLSYGENPKSLSYLGSNWYRDVLVSGRQTELPWLIRAIAMLALARKNHASLKVNKSARITHSGSIMYSKSSARFFSAR